MAQKLLIKTNHTNNLSSVTYNPPVIWVYNLIDLSLIEKAPFKSKVDCANILGISRSTVVAYLDTNKCYIDRWIFSSNLLTVSQLS